MKPPRRICNLGLVSKNTNIPVLGTLPLNLNHGSLCVPLEPSVSFLCCESRNLSIFNTFSLNTLYVAVTVLRSKDFYKTSKIHLAFRSSDSRYDSM